MEIIYLSKIKTMGVTPEEPNGVLIKDMDAQYHVLNDTLLNTVMFPQLLESGYKLVALPCTFEKDGLSTKRLPVEEYSPSPEEEEKLYSMIGAKFNNGDFSSYITAPTSSMMEMPRTDYTITTREAFLKYLDNINMYSGNSYLPLNYFVSQNALFSLEEYFNPENAEYRKIIERRRTLSYRDFYKLYSFLTEFGINENSSAFDIVTAYFAWGIDGIKWTTTSTNIELSEYPVQAYNIRSSDFYNYERCIGLSDNKRSKIVPPDKRDKMWDLEPKYAAIISNLSTPNEFGEVELKDGMTYLVQFQRKTNIKICEFFCGNYTFKLDKYQGLISIAKSEDATLNNKLHSMTSLRVISDTYGLYIPLEMAIPTKQHMNDYYKKLYIHAIATYILKKRKVLCDSTSYKILTMMGLTPIEAITYVATKLKRTLSEEYDGSVTLITEADIEAYCDGTWEEYSSKIETGEALEKYEFIDGVVNGSINIDLIESGIARDCDESIDKIVEEITVINEILEVPLSDIYESVKNAEVGTLIEFTGNNITRTLSLAKIDAHYRNTRNEITEYMINSAREANVLCEVQKVARELGDNDCKRHVAIEVLMLTRSKELKVILDILAQKYAEKFEISIVNEVVRKALLNSISIFAVRALFEIYHTGQFTYFNVPGNPKEDAAPMIVDTINRSMKTKFDSLDAFMKYSMRGKGYGTYNMENGIGEPFVKDYIFNIFCVNAYLTPQYVIPKYPIKEVSFNVMWKNYIGTSLYDTLKEMGAIDDTTIAYKDYYFDYSFLDYNNPDDEDSSVPYYYNHAQHDIKEAELLKHSIVKSVMHPTEWLYPGIYQPEEFEESDVETEGIDIHTGYNRMITREDYAFLTNFLVTEDTVQSCDVFTGFDAETYYLNINTFDAIPEDNGDKALIYDSERFITMDTKESYDYTRVVELMNAGYPVKHLRSNIYLVKLVTGIVMEVHT